MILYYDFEDVVLEAETEGGCIESLTDGVKNILYPRTTINIDGKEKTRREPSLRAEFRGR